MKTNTDEILAATADSLRSLQRLREVLIDQSACRNSDDIDEHIADLRQYAEAEAGVRGALRCLKSSFNAIFEIADPSKEAANQSST